MSDFRLNCPHCNRPLKARDALRGRAMPCPSCRGLVQVPQAAAGPAEALRPPVRGPSPASQPAAEVVFCTHCGEQNTENNFRCVRCGAVLHEPSGPPHPATDNGTLGGLIPYKNAWALLAYYLGVFALIPCLGVPLGIAAVVLGIVGLHFAKSHPEARGKGHAWVGIVLGGLSTTGHVLIAISIALFT